MDGTRSLYSGVHFLGILFDAMGLVQLLLEILMGSINGSSFIGNLEKSKAIACSC